MSQNSKASMHSSLLSCLVYSSLSCLLSNKSVHPQGHGERIERNRKERSDIEEMYKWYKENKNYEKYRQIPWRTIQND